MSYFTQDGTASSCRSDRHGKVVHYVPHPNHESPKLPWRDLSYFLLLCSQRDHVAGLGAISVGRHRLNACFLCWRAQQRFGCVLDVRCGE